ncbi:MAG: hypothetical protein ABSA11_13485 [Candidatus Bathyarchaeia archaeon]
MKETLLGARVLGNWEKNIAEGILLLRAILYKQTTPSRGHLRRSSKQSNKHQQTSSRHQQDMTVIVRYVKIKELLRSKDVTVNDSCANDVHSDAVDVNDFNESIDEDVA